MGLKIGGTLIFLLKRETSQATLNNVFLFLTKITNDDFDKINQVFQGDGSQSFSSSIIKYIANMLCN